MAAMNLVIITTAGGNLAVTRLLGLR